MSIPELLISPIDGRYQRKTKVLSNYYSEFGYQKYRIIVELKYLSYLLNFDLLDNENIISKQIGIKSINSFFEELIYNFEKNPLRESTRIKEIEKITNHDVKAVEYYLQEKFKENNFVELIPFIHIGLTSQDINTTSIVLSTKNFINNCLFTKLDRINLKLYTCANDYDVSMLSRTHGQPATPTTMRKEFMVFFYRLTKQIDQLKKHELYTKFGGAVGNMKSMYSTYPEINWENEMNKFIKSIGLKRSKYTTQVDGNESLIELFDIIKRINFVLIDMCQDIWLYIMQEYFVYQKNDNEIGSSTMPHKINPIDFENAEGNLYVANQFAELFSRRLPISRLQRDLTDSTIMRNIGTFWGHCLIAYESIFVGLEKLMLNEPKILDDLDNHAEVNGEAIQTILRKNGFDNAYEMVKELTRNHEKITLGKIKDWIHSLSINDNIKRELYGCL
mgnify:CR=1 FL=1